MFTGNIDGGSHEQAIIFKAMKINNRLCLHLLAYQLTIIVTKTDFSFSILIGDSKIVFFFTRFKDQKSQEHHFDDIYGNKGWQHVNSFHKEDTKSR